MLTVLKERHDLLMKFYALMRQHDDDLSLLIVLENGKPLKEAQVCVFHRVAVNGVHLFT